MPAYTRRSVSLSERAHHTSLQLIPPLSPARAAAAAVCRRFAFKDSATRAKEYTGKDIFAAHKHLIMDRGLGVAHFDAVGENLVGTRTRDNDKTSLLFLTVHTGGKAEAWCLLIHADASLSL